MAHRRARSQALTKLRIPRIRAAEASEILSRCDQMLENSRSLLANLRLAGIAELLSRMDDGVLQLAVQPDSWGERTRGRLMSDLARALRAEPETDSTLPIEDIVQITNVVMLCFLLEIGRRKGHIQVQFPLNPAHADACFVLSSGPPYQAHSITAERLLQIVEKIGADLVGMCYFGDPESRLVVEAELNLETAPRNAKQRSCRNSSSS